MRYSVPHQLVDTRVWARFNGDELVVTAVGEDGPAEVARHDRSTPGSPQIKDEHYPPREDKEGDRTPRANSAEESAFLALGPGAASWLIEAGAAGARRVKSKMAEAVALAKLHSAADVDRALGSAAIAGRFAENDLIRILTYQVGLETVEPTRPSEDHSLQPGTSAWSNFGIADEKEELMATSIRTVTGTHGDPLAEAIELTWRLKLPYIRRALTDLIPTAKAQGWDPAEVVRALLSEEAAGRDAANLRTRRKRAGFPAGKTFGDWDETASSIPRPTQDSLKMLEWVTRKENLCICGPSGTGKSLTEALGHAAIDAGMTVAWFTIEDLGALVRRHRADDSLARAMARLIRTDLIIVDYIGLACRLAGRCQFARRALLSVSPRSPVVVSA